jgi:cytochrome c-type biogenesis protein CcmH
MAMSPAARISSASTVIVTARVSKSGNALPQPGDLSGQLGPVSTTAAGVVVEIRDTVKP